MEELDRLNRILNMVIKCNQALVRVKDEEELIRNVTDVFQKAGFISRITREKQSDITGYETHLTFPLELDNISLGYLEIFSNESLSDLEYTILKVLADDIVYVVLALRDKKALESLGKRYKTIFENAPIALLEGNFSSIKRFLDKIESLGITDIEEYLDKHEGEILECLNNIIITDVNNACIRLYNAKTKEDLLRPKIIDRGPIKIGKDLIITFYRKKIEFEGESINYTLDGKPLFVYIKTFIPPGYEDSLERVIVSIVDITRQRMLENELRKSINEVVESFSKLVELRDPYTAGHQARVAKLACEIGKRIGLSQRDLEDLRIAGLLHDIGKVIIPADILNKPGRLNDLEFALVKLHPKTGYDILKEVEAFSNIANIVLQHHERLNGSGYPNGIRDGEIILSARIIAVADVVEAMLSHRPYRPAFRLEEVVDELERGKGILYDQDVVNICRGLLSEGFSF